jgi:hypothetical protein
LISEKVMGPPSATAARMKSAAIVFHIRILSLYLVSVFAGAI